MVRPVAFLLFACASAGSICGQSPAANPSTFQEFTMVRLETTGNESGSVLSRRVLDAHRVDGSWVQATVDGSGNLDPQAGRHVRLVPERTLTSVHDRLRLKSTLYLPGSPMAPAKDPQCGLSHISKTVNPTYAGEDEILGIRAVKIRTESRTDDESNVDTTWFAPDLDCVGVRVVADRFDKDGKPDGHFEMRATEITRGTPDAKWFVIPGDYAEKSPSQMQAALWGDGVPPNPAVSEQMKRRTQREDQRYYANHRDAGK
jgi:hypothetical protein